MDRLKAEAPWAESTALTASRARTTETPVSIRIRARASQSGYTPAWAISSMSAAARQACSWAESASDAAFAVASWTVGDSARVAYFVSIRARRGARSTMRSTAAAARPSEGPTSTSAAPGTNGAR